MATKSGNWRDAALQRIPPTSFSGMFAFSLIDFISLHATGGTHICEALLTDLFVVLYFRSVDCKSQIEALNKSALESNTKAEPDSALACQVSQKHVLIWNQNSLKMRKLYMSVLNFHKDLSVM